MTQSGGNGHKPDVQSEEVTVYEPAYLPGTDEQVGWIEASLDGERENLVSNLPPEMEDPQNPSTPN